MDADDPHGARARFLTALKSLEANGDEPAQLCQASVLSLPVRRAAIAVHVYGAGLEVLCASDDVAEHVEWMQITLGEGPGVDAVASGGPVIVPDVAARSARWPAFAPEAASAGVGALYALPLEVGAIRVGVLDLYRDEPAPMEPDDLTDALVVADLITAILLTVGRTGRLTDALGPWWDQPLGTREVHQATGMIVAQLEVTAHEAYVRMQAFAYARGSMLSEVAHAVVNRTLRFSPDPGADPEEVAAQQ
jgi:hypothetical protein